ncbi:MAG: hypothetical protein OXT51_02305 [Chloroflexota bacterium]|nr:hypothetical protein [Chloroflexota bacterium]
MSVHDHLQVDERIELQHPPFYLTNLRLLRSDDGDGSFRELPRIGMTGVERIHVTDHRIMVVGVVLVVSGAVLALTLAPFTAWLAIVAGLFALLMGARGKLVGHQVVSPRISEREQELWRLPSWGADNFVGRLRAIAAENRPRDREW